MNKQARAEVDYLLVQLQVSGCSFQRNGSWYTGEEAKSHLLRKLDYLETKDMVQSTEQFIERGASKSSMTGRAYQVRCPGAGSVPSQRWLMERLEVLRQQKSAMNSSSVKP